MVVLSLPLKIRMGRIYKYDEVKLRASKPVDNPTGKHT